jgi:hypothetical protein
MPLPEVLDVALHMAEALESAHAAGIVHRDLKPANVMLTTAGAKLLDFGVAKRSHVIDLDAGVQSTVTTEGQIIGTVAYMSPEQAEGRAVDARSDLFSFGSILYEMTTGQRPFQGDSSMSTMAAILRENPAPVRKLLPTSPAELDNLIRRCLQKIPGDRPSSATDIREELERLRSRINGNAPSWPLTKAVGAIAAVTAFAILAWSFSPVGRANKEPKAPVRVTTEAGNARYPALSADGKLLAYASDRSGNYDIYVRQVGGSSDVRLTSSSHNESAPTFTPDGQYIVYQSDEPGAQVQVIPTLGGARRVLAARGVRPRVSPEGHHVLIWTNPHGGDEALGEGEIAVVPFAGGAPRRLQANFKHVGFPIWLEESNRYLFWGRTEPDAVSDWWVGDLNNDTAQGTGVGPAAKKLGMMRRVPKPAFAYGGSVYGWMQVGDTHTLIKAEFPRDNPKDGLKLTRVLDIHDRMLEPSVSSNGLVAYGVNIRNRNLHRLRLDPTGLAAVGELEELTTGVADNRVGTLSDDGRTLGYVSDRDTNEGLWVRDLVTGEDKKVANIPTAGFYRGYLSPDGQKVAYVAFEKVRLLRMTPISGGESVTFPSAHDRVSPIGWKSADVLLAVRESEKGDTYQWIEISYPAAKVVNESAWMPVGTAGGCTPQKRIELCFDSGEMRIYAMGKPKDPKHPPVPIQGDTQLMLINDQETALYWHERSDGKEVLRAVRINPSTGLMLGAPVIAYRFPPRLRVADGVYQSRYLRNGNAVITMQSESSNVWLQALPQ